MRDDEHQPEDYRPIPCGLYSQYEVAILRATPLRLRWRDDNGIEHIERVVPLDLQTRDHCEYLMAKNSAGLSLAIRLDRILDREQEQA